MSQPPVIRLTTPGDIAAAVPYLCGFVPTESLVAISLRGDRKRIGLTLRIDLPHGGDEKAADEVAARLAHDGAAHVVLVLYTGASGPLPRAALVESITAAVELRGMAVMEALLVREGRWSSYSCSRPACCPPEGTPLGVVDALAAEAAYDGRAVLRDRAELVAVLAPPVLLAARAAEQRLDQAMVRWLAELAERGLGAARSSAVEAFGCAASAGRVREEDADALVASLQDLSVRDEVATLALDHSEGLLAVLLELARRSVAPYDVPVCTLVALVSWVRGDGALANVALDRALDGDPSCTDPSCTMAGLLRAGLDRQLPPTAVKDWLRETRRVLQPRPRRRRQRRAA